MEICLQVFGPAPLSQAGLVRVQTLPGTAQGSDIIAIITITLQLV